MKSFIIDINGTTTHFPHVWERCVGSCHAATGLRADWRAQLKKCHEELGFESVRCHGLFDDRMSVFGYTQYGPYFSFHNINLVYDYLIELGMKPFVELSFMPREMASGNQTAFHYQANVTPPKDESLWIRLITDFAVHLINRYGIEEVSTWYFELWNEPESNYFWAGGQEGYFRLYQITANALGQVDSRLQIGGPATGGERWIDDIITYCDQNNVPLDFVSTHHYPTDVGIGFDHPMEERMATSRRGALREKTVLVREKVGKRPLFYTEWNNSPGNRDVYHDMPYAAAFVAKTLSDNQGLTDVYSFFAFTDIFEEMQTSSLPFHGSFGLMNLHGIPKPTYRAFQLFHEMGEERLSVVGSESNTLEVLAVKKGASTFMLLAFNHNIPLSPIEEETAVIEIHGIKGIQHASLRRIDEDHCNPRKSWLTMGSPEYPSREQLDRIMESSEFVIEPVDYTRNGDVLTLTVLVPAHGIAAITIEL